MAVFVALLNHDPQAAKLAVMCNAIYLGATPGWLVGLLDTGALLPRLDAQKLFLEARDETAAAQFQRVVRAVHARTRFAIDRAGLVQPRVKPVWELCGVKF